MIDKGYLLSTRDLCGLEYLPQLINANIDSFKIEGRMKTPNYVATVTRIYRKYIDMITDNFSCDNFSYKISERDKNDLLQVFNRGGFSNGHLPLEANKDLIFPETPTDIGIYIGNIANYNPNKGYITLNLNDSISIGDVISIEGMSGKYNVSELILNNENLKFADAKSIVKLGRMKGNIKTGSKVYKLSSKQLSKESELTYLPSANIKKLPLTCSIKIKKDLPISVKLEVTNNPPFYNDISIEYISNIIPDIAKSNPITKERIISQFSKLGNTPYFLDCINVDLDNNLHIESISDLNEIRRNSISLLMAKLMSNSLANRNSSDITFIKNINSNTIININDRKISLLLEDINLDNDYTLLNDFDNIYIPLKFLTNSKYFKILNVLSQKYNMYVYMPTIIKANYKNLLLHNIDEIVENFNIKGFVISNIAGILLLEKYISSNKFDIVANYTLNVFNNYTIRELRKLGIHTITPSTESNMSILNSLIQSDITVELIAYCRAILMNTSYCLLSKTNKCYPNCTMKCSNNKKYYLKDRLGLKFRIMPDNIQTVTSIYNSKITSIDTTKFNVNSLRINILDENIQQINDIIYKVKSGKKIEGEEYTNGNLNREI